MFYAESAQCCVAAVKALRSGQPTIHSVSPFPAPLPTTVILTHLSSTVHARCPVSRPQQLQPEPRVSTGKWPHRLCQPTAVPPPPRSHLLISSLYYPLPPSSESRRDSASSNPLDPLRHATEPTPTLTISSYDDSAAGAPGHSTPAGPTALRQQASSSSTASSAETPSHDAPMAHGEASAAASPRASQGEAGEVIYAELALSAAAKAPSEYASVASGRHDTRNASVKRSTDGAEYAAVDFARTEAASWSAMRKASAVSGDQASAMLADVSGPPSRRGSPVLSDGSPGSPKSPRRGRLPRWLRKRDGQRSASQSPQPPDDASPDVSPHSSPKGSPRSPRRAYVPLA